MHSRVFDACGYKHVGFAVAVYSVSHRSVFQTLGVHLHAYKNVVYLCAAHHVDVDNTAEASAALHNVGVVAYLDFLYVLGFEGG